MTSDSNREVRFRDYLWGHYAGARGLSIYGVALALLLAPVLSLLRPHSFVCSGVLMSVAGLACLSAGAYLVARVGAYYVARQRTLTEPRSLLASLAHKLLIGLLFLLPFVGADRYFEKGWLVTLVPPMQDAQRDLLRLVGQAQSWAGARPSSDERPVADSTASQPPALVAAGDDPKNRPELDPLRPPQQASAPAPSSDPAVEDEVAIEPGPNVAESEPLVDQPDERVETDAEVGEPEDHAPDSNRTSGTSLTTAELEADSATSTAPRESPPRDADRATTPVPATPGVSGAGGPRASKTSPETSPGPEWTAIPPFRFSGPVMAVEFHADESAPAKTSPQFGEPLKLEPFQARKRNLADLTGMPPGVLILEKELGDTLRVRDLFSVETCEIPAAAVTSLTPIATFQQIPFAHQMRYLTWRLLASSLPIAGRITGQEGLAWHTTLSVQDGVNEGSLLQVFELTDSGHTAIRRVNLRLKHFDELGSVATHESGPDAITEGSCVLPNTAREIKLAIFPARVRFAGGDRTLDFEDDVIERKTVKRGTARSQQLVQYCHERGERMATAFQSAVAGLGLPQVEADDVKRLMASQFTYPWWSWEPGNAYRAGQILQATHVWFAEIEPRSSRPPCPCEVRFSVLDVRQNKVIETYEFLLSPRQSENLVKWAP